MALALAVVAGLADARVVAVALFAALERRREVFRSSGHDVLLFRA
jgi:hypothetical protein